MESGIDYFTSLLHDVWSGEPHTCCSLCFFIKNKRSAANNVCYLEKPHQWILFFLTSNFLILIFLYCYFRISSTANELRVIWTEARAFSEALSVENSSKNCEKIAIITLYCAYFDEYGRPADFFSLSLHKYINAEIVRLRWTKIVYKYKHAPFDFVTIQIPKVISTFYDHVRGSVTLGSF